ncbi:MAG: CTP synthase [Bifidobacteriaceae bacterium]|nr:CTP synthase [Bifidobacteriaceae bacterium]
MGADRKLTKQIFITGGVVSSLGKGITASSLGRLLRSHGLKVQMQKLDPYINVDPGTMNPFQHGEVFVTEDGAETDLDIGHYERFLDINLSQSSNTTTGRIYSAVIKKERAGEYLGDTVQVIPHVTNEIKAHMRAQADSEVDVIITEIGGTIGDIESQPFLEAARQLQHELGFENVAFVHVSLVPYIPAARELKTKPTQHSISVLRSIGISPQALVLRSDRELPDGHKQKISLMTGIEMAGVIACPDSDSIYKVPARLHDEGLDNYLIQKLQLPFRDIDWHGWDTLVAQLDHPKSETIVAVVGKYIDVRDAYLSVCEALKHAALACETKLSIRWVAADDITEMSQAEKVLTGVQALVIPGGFGVRGIEGKLSALRWARENQVPALGLCLGLQSMVIEFSRNVLGFEDADSTEFNPDTSHPVIATMQEQRKILADCKLGGTMRLGSYPAVLQAQSLVQSLYGTNEVAERHRHRYEVNNSYRDVLENAGLKISGTSPEPSHELVEFVELDRKLHSFYVGTQAHPELKSRPTSPHPLFLGLIQAALSKNS